MPGTPHVADGNRSLGSLLFSDGLSCASSGAVSFARMSRQQALMIIIS